jgi:hypothetical protein
MIVGLPDSITNTELADYYDAAADYLIIHGWTRTELYNNRSGAVCASGALCATLSPTLFEQVVAGQPIVITGSTYLRWMEAARRLLDGWSVSHWNDNIAKDQDEVIEKFRSRAKELRDA